MNTFLDSNFLLETPYAVQLYQDVAATLPIIDFHTHLPPDQLANNHRFETITELWLDGDHYKWRAMRCHGVDEERITGRASPREKFKAWAETVPHTIRNPLYHWSHLELKNYFGIDTLLNLECSDAIYERCNSLLQQDDFCAQKLLTRMNVELVCTTDDPTDSLQHHALLAEQQGAVPTVLPTWRPDLVFTIDNPARFNAWILKLERSSSTSIATFQHLMDALEDRHAHFHRRGCRLADHGVDKFYVEPYTASSIERTFDKARRGQTPGPDEVMRFRSAMLYHLAVLNHRRGWVQQFHFGALRNIASRQFQALGSDSGFDAIGGFETAAPLASFLNELDKTDQLAQTVLYNSNPSDNHVVATIAACFNDGSVPGKVQWGPAWWHLDQRSGIIDHLNTLSELGLLSHFIGMVADSRSFLSTVRHDYFRRVLCNELGNDISHGRLPNDPELLGSLVKSVCYQNARDRFCSE